MDNWFDLKIILEFDRIGAVVEWLKGLKLVYDQSGVKQLDCVIPLRLTRGTFAV